MKAVVLKKYGPPEVLQLNEVEKPSPKKNEILIKVFASSVNFGDIMARKFKAVTPQKFNMPFLFWLMGKIYFGFSKPRITILGNEFSGVVESVSKNVKSFRTGDNVFGYVGPRMGAYAEYMCVPENGCVSIKPASMNFEEAAAVPYGAVMALNIISRIKSMNQKRVLINGASGAIGSAFVQFAKYFGAEVTGVCSGQKIEFVQSIGADKVFDYTKDDFIAGGSTYDFIIDILGKLSFAHCKSALAEDGQLLFISFKMKQILQMLWRYIVSGKKVKCLLAKEKPDYLAFLKDQIDKGNYKIVIDKSFPLNQTAGAHRFVEEGKKKGSVVISLNNKQSKLSGH